MILHKTNKTKRELERLQKENYDLFDIIIETANFVSINFNKDIVITHLFRTEDQQDYFYRNSAKYKKRKFKSPHQFWHGVDLRSWTFTDTELKKIENFLNKTYNKSNHYRWTCKAHNVGSGIHFHIQFFPKKS